MISAGNQAYWKRRTSARTPPAALSWAPPGYPDYEDFVVLHLDNDTAGRFATLDDETDYLVVYDEPISLPTVDGFISFTGGRHIVSIGGHVTAPVVSPTTTLTAQLNAADTTIEVADTTGYPMAGALRIRREYWTYTGKTGTTFTGAVKGALSSGGVAAPHPIGASVFPAESTRRALAFYNPNNVDRTIHIEGFLGDGVDLTEGIHFAGPGRFQLQNSRILVSGRDQVTFYDNHPDAVQILKGPEYLYLDRVTLRSDYQALFINGLADGGVATGETRIRHTNLLGVVDAALDLPRAPLLRDFDGSIVEVDNVWVDPGANMSRMVSPFAAEWGRGVILGTPSSGDFCPAGTPGMGYVSPGYDE